MRITRGAKGFALTAVAMAAALGSASAASAALRVVEPDVLWSYQGNYIQVQQVVDRGLHCFDDAQPVTRCYGSIRALEDAEGVQIGAGVKVAFDGTVRAATRRPAKFRRIKGRAKARVATHAGDPLTLWDVWWRSGFSWSTSQYGVWVNVHPFLDNYASELYTGNHSGCGALDPNGGGRYGRWDPVVDVNLTGTFADNATSSVARGNC